MVKERVLVTGANGYIGARLCQYLSEKGYLVSGLCYPSQPEEEKWTKKLEKVFIGDIRDETLLEHIAKSNRYEVIINLVSLDHHDSAQKMPAEVTPINITPTWSLLSIFSKYGLKKFIYFSTVHVYGTLQGEIISEDQAIDARNAYALTHALSEQICDYYNRNSSIDCTTVRLSNSYGAPIFKDNNCWWLVINDLCKMAYEKKQIVLSSDGTPQRDFIHGWDVCKAIYCILNNKGVKYDTYNICSGTTFTIEELAYKIQQIYKSRYDREISVAFSKEKQAFFPQKKYKISNSRLIETGYIAEWDLERGITDLFDYLEYK